MGAINSENWVVQQRGDIYEDFEFDFYDKNVRLTAYKYYGRRFVELMIDGVVVHFSEIEDENEE